MTEIGRHLIIDGIFEDTWENCENLSDRDYLSNYLERITKITGMTLVFPPMAMKFPFAGETSKLIKKLDEEGACKNSKVFSEFKEHINQRDTEGGGVSAIAVWVESHCTLHSWTEKNYISIDLFSCSSYDIEPVIDYTIDALGLSKAAFVCIDRKMSGDLPDIRTFDLKDYLSGRCEQENNLLQRVY